MKSSVFKSIWPDIINKPVEVTTGYRTPKKYNVVFVSYKEYSGKGGQIYLLTNHLHCFTVRPIRKIKVL